MGGQCCHQQAAPAVQTVHASDCSAAPSADGSAMAGRCSGSADEGAGPPSTLPAAALLHSGSAGAEGSFMRQISSSSAFEGMSRKPRRIASIASLQQSQALQQSLAARKSETEGQGPTQEQITRGDSQGRQRAFNVRTEDSDDDEKIAESDMLQEADGVSGIRRPLASAQHGVAGR
mmetsp:Transcript_63669/g.183132  ORF Transcript_63669/g.183132 Transcript_63669/m.183132 type:complete len:176 (+) Transcript_63669:51-578(+)